MVLADVTAEGVSTMAETWKQWEGQVVDGLFPLRQLLSGGEQNAIFLTDYGAHEPRAAIKLVSANPEAEESVLSRWAVAERLAHPNLIRVLQSGRCRLYNRQNLYLVMELADEDLSRVLAERPLTAGEAGEMLSAVLGSIICIQKVWPTATSVRLTSWLLAMNSGSRPIGLQRCLKRRRDRVKHLSTIRQNSGRKGYPRRETSGLWG